MSRPNRCSARRAQHSATCAARHSSLRRFFAASTAAALDGSSIELQRAISVMFRPQPVQTAERLSSQRRTQGERVGGDLGCVPAGRPNGIQEGGIAITGWQTIARHRPMPMSTRGWPPPDKWAEAVGGARSVCGVGGGVRADDETQRRSFPGPTGGHARRRRQRGRSGRCNEPPQPRRAPIV